jgi:hypothetical protein
MFFVLVLEGLSGATAKPVVATRDPDIVRVVADAITARLQTSRTVTSMAPCGPPPPDGD